jgi:hypothetical protein
VDPKAGLDRRGKSCPPPVFDPRTAQPVASHYTDYATRPTYLLCTLHIKHVKIQRPASSLRRMDKLVVSPDLSNLYTVGCADLVAESARFWTEAATDASVCVLSVTEWLVLDDATPISIRTYKFRAANKILPPTRTFVSRKTLTPLCGTQFQKHRSNRTGLKPLSEPPVLQVKRSCLHLLNTCYKI